MVEPSEWKATFRLMTESDIPQVQALDKLSFSLPWPESAFHYEVKENTASRCWVAEVQPDGVIAAILVIWLIIDEAHIGTLAVHPQYRRKGLAEAILRLGLTEAAHEGARAAYLEVRAGNTAAINLYKKFGYIPVTVRPRYYHDNNEDAVLMNLEPDAFEKLISSNPK
ncbi:MAG TPA: ribosomal protein S18-alanine N-acetyltransferase [Longilinea sp.]|nr:ribosomal protein S18-alanine N-acetyltransferase [Longilinea sp.]